jgi:hypothetical protein
VQEKVSGRRDPNFAFTEKTWQNLRGLPFCSSKGFAC